jgi:type II secretory pathway component PulK
MKHNRRGLILVLVLVVIAMLSLGAYSFSDLMFAQHEATVLTGKQLQARGLVDSGAEAVRLFLSLPPAQQTEAGGHFDNPDRFRGLTLIQSDDPNDRGNYSIIAPNLDSDGNLTGVRHGLEDESTRLNLNVLTTLDQAMSGMGRQLLMPLPGMTEDVADAILDWLDADDEPREYGCEIEYYSGLTPPYKPKNGPLETVEELLLVRGVTPQLLFGADINRNGQLDPHEAGEEESSGGSTDPAAFRGWSAYLTLHSLEWNITPDRQPRIYLNGNDLNVLYESLAAVLPEEWAAFIIMYRQAGPSTGAVSTSPQVASEGLLDMNYQAQFPITQVLDLIGAQVQYMAPGSSTPIVVASPLTELTMNTYMSQLMDFVTVNPAATIPGRININQASATVLSGIASTLGTVDPDRAQEIMEAIISRRSIDVTGENAAHRHETWLLAEGIVTLEEMRLLMPLVCGGGNVYRAQVIGYLQNGQASSRAEIIFDATTPLPRILLWRDLSHLGRGYALETLGVDLTQ